MSASDVWTSREADRDMQLFEYDLEQLPQGSYSNALFNFRYAVSDIIMKPYSWSPEEQERMEREVEMPTAEWLHMTMNAHI